MSGPFKLRSGNTTPFKQMGSSPAKQTKFPIPAAKRITKKHVGHTTVDAPKPQDESKFDKSQRKMQHVDKLLKRAGYDLGEREQATGAGGYKAAMDWATSKEKSPAKQVEKDKRKGPSYSHYREGTLKALKQVNPVIQGAKLIKETSKATVKGLKERPKKNPSHTGVRKI
jgi:hypothetical protein